jgi:energy-coupling factor transporter ATP-binding protein EcfA2
MYIDTLELTNVRMFVKDDWQFVHPDSEFRPPESNDAGDGSLLPRPKLPNVNLLLGDNGSGKTTLLQAIALATLGPAAPDAQLPLRPFVRFRAESARRVSLQKSTIRVRLHLHEQDGDVGTLVSRLEIGRRGELESIRFRGEDRRRWSPVFESQNEAFFCASYGATRRIDAGETLERGTKPRARFLRGERTQSIFQESFGLYPLAWWLPELKATSPGRYDQVRGMLNEFLSPSDFRFTGELRNREYLFERGKMLIPLPSLSDGYRAFVGWISDLLYHVCYGCPSEKKLEESCGIVMVDEIDLHLHPRWQMRVVETVAKALPRMQFIFTSHSPLVVGSLEWMNILTMKVDSSKNETDVERLKQSIHGLDADQVLLSEFFGLETTRAPGKVSELAQLERRARHGDKAAARQIILSMARGTEPAE